MNNLVDTYFRTHDYLRVSLTDACNFNCVYCKPESNYCATPAAKLMTPDEIFSISEIFVGMGIKKIRLTGGEPLLRKEFRSILQKLSTLPVKLAITTNGFLIEKFIDDFTAAKLFSVNVSLDSLHPGKFFSITGNNCFEKILKNILLLSDNGFRVKLNVVLMRGTNEQEILDFIEITRLFPIHVRFIEFMPFRGNQWEKWKMAPFHDILERVQESHPVIKLYTPRKSTAKKFKVDGYSGTFAVISTISQPFCSNCNRLRITASGNLKNCLYSNGETDLLTPFRNGKDIRPLIISSVQAKARERGGLNFDNKEYLDIKEMVKIGG